jgi:hypothetical protein
MKNFILLFLILMAHAESMMAQNLPATKRKFTPKVQFDAYSVPMYSGPRVKPLNAKYFSDKKRNALKQAWKKGEVNYAGHFYLVFWPISPTRQMSAMLDIKTGRVYDAPWSCSFYQFKKDSRLLIVSPPNDDKEGFYEPKDCNCPLSVIYIWDDSRKLFKQHSTIKLK